MQQLLLSLLYGEQDARQRKRSVMLARDQAAGAGCGGTFGSDCICIIMTSVNEVEATPLLLLLQAFKPQPSCRLAEQE